MESEKSQFVMKSVEALAAPDFCVSSHLYRKCLMLIFYFDTSVINHLFDDPELAIRKKAFSESCIVYPSVFNIAEIASTTETERRNGLLKLTKEISAGYRPLAMPGDLLKRSLVSVNQWASDMDHSMGTEWEGVWLALKNPDLIDEKAFREIIGWKENQEEWYQKMHDLGRPRMQEAIRKFSPSELAALTSSFSKMIRLYSPEGEFVTNLVYDLASNSGANVQIDRNLVTRIIRHSEHWRFFLTSMAYGMHARSMKMTHFGKDSNPGSIDTQQAIYLTSCDVFVSADTRQRRMLRLLAPFGHKKRRIWDYSKLSRWLRNHC